MVVPVWCLDDFLMDPNFVEARALAEEAHISTIRSTDAEPVMDSVPEVAVETYTPEDIEGRSEVVVPPST